MQFRNLPSVESVMVTDKLSDMATTYQREWMVNLVRYELEQARQQIRRGGAAPAASEVAEAVRRSIESMAQVAPRPVINATGVIIHTNLGRAPLSRAATEAMVAAAQGYSNLEVDLEDGRRGSRQAHLQPLLQQLTGAEAALVVNNNASAVLLGLSALATGKEVIVSRGEAVEIGGGFRIPDVLRQSGATLMDVGATNRTYVRDYEDAIGETTAALLKAHVSNFRIEGFTASVELGELVELGQRHGIPVLHDVGSGCLLNTEKYGLAHEPTPQESVAAGAGLVFFSGDKLLGGPQAGIIVGKRELVRRLEQHPLAPGGPDRQAEPSRPYRHPAPLPASRGGAGGTRLADDCDPGGGAQAAGQALAIAAGSPRLRGAMPVGHRGRQPTRRDAAVLGAGAVLPGLARRPRGSDATAARRRTTSGGPYRGRPGTAGPPDGVTPKRKRRSSVECGPP